MCTSGDRYDWTGHREDESDAKMSGPKLSSRGLGKDRDRNVGDASDEYEY